MVSASCRDTDRTPSVSTVTAPWSPYDIPDQEEISEAKEKVPTKDGDHLTTQTDRPIKGGIGVKKQDTGKRYVEDPTPPTGSTCVSHTSPTGVRGNASGIGSSGL